MDRFFKYGISQFSKAFPAAFAGCVKAFVKAGSNAFVFLSG